MGRLMNLVYQKLLPATKKSFWIDFRKKNGAWTAFQLPPASKSFKEGGTIYYLKGTPEIDNSTNQRKYIFLQDVPYPIGFNHAHEQLLKVNADFGNISMQLTEADEQGFQRAMLLKGKKGLDPITLLLIMVGISLLASLIILYMTYGNSDMLGRIVNVVAPPPPAT